MQIKKIKAGMWVSTTMGYGKVISVGGTFPPSVKVDILAPLPRGSCNLVPRDVQRELDQAEIVAFERLLAQRTAQS